VAGLLGVGAARLDDLAARVERHVEDGNLTVERARPLAAAIDRLAEAVDALRDSDD
jgi:hypothetical protein